MKYCKNGHEKTATSDYAWPKKHLRSDGVIVVYIQRQCKLCKHPHNPRIPVTQCPQGHEYTLENTCWNKETKVLASGEKKSYAYKMCRTCRIASDYRRRGKAPLIARPEGYVSALETPDKDEVIPDIIRRCSCGLIADKDHRPEACDLAGGAALFAERRVGEGGRLMSRKDGAL